MIDVQPERALRHLVIGQRLVGNKLPPRVPAVSQLTITEVPTACPHCRAVAIIEPTCRECGAATKGQTRCACGARNDDREVRCQICTRHWYLVREGE